MCMESEPGLWHQQLPRIVACRQLACHDAVYCASKYNTTGCAVAWNSNVLVLSHERAAEQPALCSAQCAAWYSILQ